MKRPIILPFLAAAMTIPAFGGEPAGLLQKFLDTSTAYNALPVVKRTPAFRLVPVEKQKQWYYICDGDRHIGLIGEDVQLFDKEAKYSGSKVDNTFFADGARLCLTMGLFEPPRNIELPRMTSRKLTITKDRGDSVEFKHEQVHPGGYAGTVAVDNSAGTGPRPYLVRAGFLLNMVNDFENFVPSDRVYNGAIFQHIDASEGEAHSGKYSLALRGPGPGKVKVASPVGGGPPLPSEHGRSYRLSAWVKTKGLADGGACLEVSGWRENNQRFTSRSESKLAGDHDWTPLQITFGPMSGGMGIRLCAEGTGTAWFDDVELVELPR